MTNIPNAGPAGRQVMVKNRPSVPLLRWCTTNSYPCECQPGL